jgi:hypothetical protein
MLFRGGSEPRLRSDYRLSGRSSHVPRSRSRCRVRSQESQDGGRRSRRHLARSPCQPRRREHRRVHPRGDHRLENRTKAVEAAPVAATPSEAAVMECAMLATIAGIRDCCSGDNLVTVRRSQHALRSHLTRSLLLVGEFRSPSRADAVDRQLGPGRYRGTSRGSRWKLMSDYPLL